MTSTRDEERSIDQFVVLDNFADTNVLSSEKRYHIHGPHVFAIVIGIVINIPTFFSRFILTFAYEEKYRPILYIVKSLSTLCSITIVYICSYHLKRNFRTFLRQSRLTTNEYILILSSCGLVAYFTLGVLTAFTYPDIMTIYVCSRVLSLLDVYLQTYFFIKVKRYHPNRNRSVLISSCGIILMLTNLLYWLQNSIKKNVSIESQVMVFVGRENGLVMESILVPIVTFYRFFSGMNAYSLYYKFKPQ
jgi:uncharacterized membrane protein (DUF485 family)